MFRHCCFFIVGVFFPFIGALLCHLGSDRLSSRSDEPCHCDADSFRPRVSDEFISGGKKPPLKPLVSGFLL